MLNFLSRLKYKFSIFMRGRYGMDELSRISAICALIFWVLSTVFSIGIFYYISVFLIFWIYFRCFSKNLDKRGRELCTFLKIKNTIRANFARRKKMFRERKNYRFFKCGHCGTYSRVPKGKGKIKITCGVCKKTMVKRT